MTNICNKNDFIIKLRLSDKDGVVLPYTQFDWDIRFYTTKINHSEHLVIME